MTKSRFHIGSLNVLFTCIGRRVSLLNSFAMAAKQLKTDILLLGTDTTMLSSALQLCDKRFVVKPATHTGYIRQLLKIVKDNRVNLLIPTIDTDLLVLARNKSKFAELGCSVLVSEPAVVRICQDKRKTYKFLMENGFDSPGLTTPMEALKGKGVCFPCVLKPWDGAAAKWVTIVKNRKELAFFASRIPNCMVQELIKGTEYTCDAFVDLGMRVRSVVPRKRIEVRSGEVSKSQVAKNREIMSLVAKLVKILGTGPGVITLQCFLQKDGKIKFTEINPRFGGGVPLSIKAGADFPKWILQEALGKKTDIHFDGFKDGLIMLRYDAEVWV